MGEVVMGDTDIAPNRRHDLKTASICTQILLPASGRQTLHLVLRVLGLLRSREGTKGDIGGHDMPVIAADLIEQHRQAVRLLAVATSRAPDCARLAALAPRDLGES